MACPNYGSPTFHGWVHYRLARVDSGPPRRMMWYCGPIISWLPDQEQAVEFATRKIANDVRQALGTGIIVHVFDVLTGEHVASE